MITEKEKLKLKIEELELEREELFKKKEPIDKRLIKTYNKLKKLYEKHDTIELAESNKEFDIELILAAEHKSSVKYEEAEKQTHKLGLWRAFCARWSTSKSANQLAMGSPHRWRDPTRNPIPHAVRPMPVFLCCMFLCQVRALSQAARISTSTMAQPRQCSP